jgi:hypothetical protein
VGQRAFYRWADKDLRLLFPGLPERTRLFRLLATHQDWTDRFLADPTLLGVADTYGVELIHPIRTGRSRAQIGTQTLSNKRWITGGKLGLVLNQFGRICAWSAATARVSDRDFRGLVARFEERMVILTDWGFHGREGDPSNMKVCRPRTCNPRMLVETVLSMLTVVCHSKHMRHRAWNNPVRPGDCYGESRGVGPRKRPGRCGRGHARRHGVWPAPYFGAASAPTTRTAGPARRVRGPGLAAWRYAPPVRPLRPSR